MEHELEEFIFSSSLPSLVGRLLFSRGIRTLKEANLFFYGDFKDLSDPFLFKDMERSVERIKKAIKSGERILVLGDYDVDGVTSTALLVKGISSLGGKTTYIIPNRFSHGYGAKIEHLQEIKKRDVSLVITVDNGIKSLEFATALKKEGIDLIITDHHLPGDRLPQAFAIINPLLEDAVPRNLAGVGVAFKLLHALLISLNMEDRAFPYLKMVAIGTIGDMMELLGENRIMVKEGLKLLNGNNSHGLSALIGMVGLREKGITPKDIAVRLSPRINAAGRMMDAEIALQLFLSSNETQAREAARRLSQLNRERQKQEAKVIKEAKSLLDGKEPHDFVMVSSNQWNRGVLGIAALRLSRLYSLPAFVFSTKDGVAYGSGRAPKGYELIEILGKVKDILEDFGGHPNAVGLVLKEENLPKLKERLSVIFREYTPEEKPEPGPEPANFSEIKNSMGYLKLFPPFGVGNPQPIFEVKNVKVVQSPSPWSDGYKVLLSQNNQIIPALFRKGSLLNKFKKGETVEEIKFSIDLSQEFLILKE